MSITTLASRIDEGASRGEELLQVPPAAVPPRQLLEEHFHSLTSVVDWRSPPVGVVQLN
jgi:hypothetical protein